MFVLRKICVLSAVMMLAMALTTGTAWAAKMSCEELSGIGEAIDNVSGALDETALDAVKPGSDTDKALQSLMAGFKKLAGMEGGEAIQQSLPGLEEALSKKNTDGFKEALGAAVVAYDQVNERDCKK